MAGKARAVRYWLTEIRDYTDLAVMACDRGMNPDAIPWNDACGLLEQGLVRKAAGRWVITKQGREFLQGEENET